MTYQKRMVTAIAVSLLIHALALGLSGFGSRLYGPGGPSPVPGPPLVVDLQPSQEELATQAVASAAPAQRSPQDTNLISDRDSNAQDPQDTVQGKVLAPLDTKSLDSYELGGGTPVPPKSKPEKLAPPAEKKAKESPRRPAAEKIEEKKAPEQAKPTNKHGEKPDAVAMAKADLGQANPAAAEQAARAAEAASGAPQPPTLPSGEGPGAKPGKFRGSIQGGIMGKGVLGFEAKKDQLAAYLLEVQRRVELKWNMAMGLRYTGTTPTKAVVDCVIGPDGNLVRVDIVKEGNSPTYAPICRESIVNAAPFPKFPFEVPDIYRDKTLEIRWTFNFL
jgi:outer membrane biosynthesis protein TonB